MPKMKAPVKSHKRGGDAVKAHSRKIKTAATIEPMKASDMVKEGKKSLKKVVEMSYKKPKRTKKSMAAAKKPVMM